MIAGVVLAAGTSSRLGRPKQLLELDAKPLLQHVLESVCAADLDEVVVVLGHAAAEIEARLSLPGRARVVINPKYAEGQSTSLRVGLGALGPDVEAAVIVLGDQPGVSSELVRRVVREWRTSGVPVLRPLFRGAPGHPVVAGRAAWNAFMGASGDEGARGVMADIEVAEVELGIDPLADIDTWDDYISVRSVFRNP